MAPLIVLVFSFVIFSLLGADGFDAWESSLRWALAAMFIFTGIAHFTRTRADLVRMVPPRLPRPEVLVTITGVLEIVGAVGLLIPSLALPAACGLSRTSMMRPPSWRSLLPIPRGERRWVAEPPPPRAR